MAKSAAATSFMPERKEKSNQLSRAIVFPAERFGMVLLLKTTLPSGCGSGPPTGRILFSIAAARLWTQSG